MKFSNIKKTAGFVLALAISVFAAREFGQGFMDGWNGNPPRTVTSD